MKKWIVLILMFVPGLLLAADCDPITVMDKTVEVVQDDSEGVEFLELRAGSLAAMLPGSGPGNRCLGITFFENAKILIVHYESGVLGTRVLRQSELAVAYRLTENSLKKLREFEIKQTEHGSGGPQLLLDGVLGLKETSKGLRVEVLDKTGNVRDHAVLP